MPFNELPEFPQGGAVGPERGTLGIPPESFTQALQDAGYAALTSRRPEDAPAVRQALDTEVDTLSRAMGHQGPPAGTQGPAQQPQQTGTPPAAPAFPLAETVASSGADLSKRPLEERIHAIMAKYGGNFEKLAEAHAHADAARTRAQQEASRYRGEFSALDNRMARIESMLEGRNAETPPQYGTPPAPAATAGPEAGGQPLTADQFFQNPEPVLRRVVEETTDRVVKSHLLAYTNAQAQYEQEQKAEQLRQNNAAEIEQLRPIMDEIYYSKAWLYDRMPRDVALTELLERARDRQAAIQAAAYHQEVKGLFGNGTPANAAPGTAGALPPSGTGQGRRPAAGAITDYSRTPAMERLWRTRSDSRDEMKALTDVLREREFGETIPTY